MADGDQGPTSDAAEPTPEQVAAGFERFKGVANELPPAEAGEIWWDFAQRLPWPDSIEAWQGAIKSYGRDPAYAFDAAVCALGLGLARLEHPEPDIEAAIAELTHGLLANPDAAEILDGLLANRAAGDPLSNWERRVDIHEQRLARLSPDEDPAKWATYNNALATARSARPGIASSDTQRERAEALRRSLDVLGDLVVDVTVHTHRELSFSLNFMVESSDDEREELDASARHHAARAVEMASQPQISPDCRRMALLQYVGLVSSSDSSTLDDAINARAALEQARHELGADAGPTSRANLAKSALLLLERQQVLTPGAHDQVVIADLMLTELATALEHLPEDVLIERMTVQLTAGNGQAAVGRFAEAIRLFGAALDDSHTWLSQAVQFDSRLEGVRKIAEASRLKADAEIRNGRFADACTTLERGRNQLFAPPGGHPTVGLDGLRNAVPVGGALLQLCVVSDPGWALVATADTIEAVALPELNGGSLKKLVQGADFERKGLGGWLLDYLSQDSSNPPTMDRFRDSIVELGAELYRRFWEPVNATLAGLGVAPGAELLLLHHGATIALPFHVAWTGSSDDPEAIVERWAIRTSPSLRLAQPSATSAAVARPRVGVVADPRRELDLEAIEIYAAGRLGGDVLIAQDEEATAERLVEMLTTQDVVHVSVHGYHLQAQILLSFLEMAEDRNFMLYELIQAIPIVGIHPWLVVLSACNSGVPRSATHADEALSFPTALLEAGANTAIGASWMADEGATALLADRFYAELADGCSPAVALNRAQRWIRSATAGELRELTRGLRKADDGPKEAAKTLQLRFGETAPTERPYLHPFYWAALTVHGRTAA